jgi:hypothetical protein
MKRLLVFGALVLVLGGAGTLAVSAQTPVIIGSTNTAQKDAVDTPEANDAADAPSATIAKDVAEAGDTQD